tara:strand:+ start:4902 stop:5171 length:270 start_codon:yes stop_codon:yes gene_type:complete
MATITNDRPNVFGTLYVMSGTYSGASGDFNIPLDNLGTVFSFVVTPTNSSFPTAGVASAVDVSGSSPVGKVDQATAGTAGRWMAIGSRS